MEESKCPRLLQRLQGWKSRRTQKAHLASPWKSFSLAQDESTVQHSGSQSLSGLLARVTPTPWEGVEWCLRIAVLINCQVTMLPPLLLAWRPHCEVLLVKGKADLQLTVKA